MKMIVLFTDGYSNTDEVKIPLSDVIRKAINNNINIVVVGFGSQYDENYLNAIAYYAGGNRYKVWHENEFSQLFENILADVNLSYEIEFSPCMFGDEIQIEMMADILESNNLTSSTFFATPADQGSSIAVDILFDPGSDEIDEEKFAVELEQIVQYLNFKKELKILIEGHTDKTESKKLNLKVTLGIQMVLMPEFKDEIIPFAKLAVDLGVDYGVIKHCSDDEFGTLGVDYTKYENLYELLDQAEKMSNEKTKVIVKWNKIKNKGKPSYNRFYGPQFLLQISGSGLVAPSGMFFNARYSKLHIGNFADERFVDIFKSERYWKIMNYLASPSFDAQTMMGTLPIQHYVSEALDQHIKGLAKIVPRSGPSPLHVNFL